MDKNAPPPPLNPSHEMYESIFCIHKYINFHNLLNIEANVEKDNLSIFHQFPRGHVDCYAIKFPTNWNLISSTKKV